eukprot:TRINITY_DN25145_c0_g1_i1.p1 TRINITY_DN25145_c0_g1~~TRINITY_DN25145_c0_g1_i1.p1  ORF type:complete len:355 (-),score=78.80 TRINITY_DN25145_c0_g1_i1:26-1090(-)
MTSLESFFQDAFNQAALAELPKPQMEEVTEVPGAFILRNVLTEAETDKLAEFVRLAHEQREKQAVETANLADSTSKEPLGEEKIRRNSQHHAPVYVQHEALKALSERVRQFLPSAAGPSHQGKLEEPGREISTFLRCYWYRTGDCSQPHFDRPWNQHSSDGSLFSFSAYSILFYLNDAFDGGHTTFFRQDKSLPLSCSGLTPLCSSLNLEIAAKVTPCRGDLLFFPHGQKKGCYPDPLHEGSEVTSGEKLLIRTDLLFRMPQKQGLVKKDVHEPEAAKAGTGKEAALHIQRLREQAKQARLAKRNARAEKQNASGYAGGSTCSDENLRTPANATVSSSVKAGATAGAADVAATC